MGPGLILIKRFFLFDQPDPSEGYFPALQVGWVGAGSWNCLSTTHHAPDLILSVLAAVGGLGVVNHVDLDVYVICGPVGIIRHRLCCLADQPTGFGGSFAVRHPPGTRALFVKRNPVLISVVKRPALQPSPCGASKRRLRLIWAGHCRAPACGVVLWCVGRAAATWCLSSGPINPTAFPGTMFSQPCGPSMTQAIS